CGRYTECDQGRFRGPREDLQGVIAWGATTRLTEWAPGLGRKSCGAGARRCAPAFRRAHRPLRPRRGQRLDSHPRNSSAQVAPSAPRRAAELRIAIVVSPRRQRLAVLELL